MKTKRILAPFDMNKPDKIYKGILYPNVDAKQFDSFLNISTGEKWELGMVVFVGREITQNDLFAKIVDSGKKVKSVVELLQVIENYLEKLNNFKIGDIVGIKHGNNKFELIKISKPPINVDKLT